MAYDPKVPGEFERTRTYNLQWLGLPAAILWLAFEIVIEIGFDREGFYNIAFIPAIFAAGSLAWPLGTLPDGDEFIRRQHLVAASWGMAATGLIAILYVFPFMQSILPSIEAPLAFAFIAVVYNSALVMVRIGMR